VCFSAHKTHHDFWLGILVKRKNNDKDIIILAVYWKKTALLIPKLATIT
jgi:hypothetical protein